ncbi:MAG TPA: SDR family NAD(P)-dependent oxidoreductase [bacterium]|nr:SDR family NAD(P)-dependent oxidoreductase [bacterium]
MNVKNKRILVTGGAGFIGSELVRQLAALGAKVTVVDNLVNGSRENLKEVLGTNVSLRVADIRNFRQMDQFFKKIEMVYHLACLGVRHSIHSPLENHQVNALGTLVLLMTAKKNLVKRFINVSSSEIYGTARKVPMTEEHPTFPLTVYGGSKLAGESYARAFHQTYNFPTVMVRPFNSYGPRSHHEGDSGEVIPKFILRCMAGYPLILFGDGLQTRDFTYVGDTARGILLAGLSQRAIGKTLNIGQGKETSIKNLAKTVKEIMGKPKAEIKYDKPRPGDVLRLYADTSQTQRLIGFKPTVPLKEGLKTLRDWFIKSGKSPVDLLKQERIHNWNIESSSKLRHEKGVRL